MSVLILLTHDSQCSVPEKSDSSCGDKSQSDVDLEPTPKKRKKFHSVSSSRKYLKKSFLGWNTMRMLKAGSAKSLGSRFSKLLVCG